MAITRVQAETLLVKRLGPLMTAAAMDGATVDGTNADLNDPLGRAVRRLSGTVADPTSVADADLATVSSENTDALLDLAELRALNSVLGNLTLVDTRVGPREQKYDQLRQAVRARIGRLEQALGDHLAAELVAGVVEMDFAEHVSAS